MKVFISHTEAAIDLARKVAEGLRREGLDAWSEEQEVLPGDNWAEMISRALNEAEAMVVLLTPDAEQSSRVRRDIEFALGNKRFRHRVIPVLVGDPTQTPEETVPWILRRLRPLRLTKPEESASEIRELSRVLLAAAEPGSAAVAAAQ